MFPGGGRKSVVGWSILTTSPYLDIVNGKFNQMEQAGIMARLQHQYRVVKVMEPEVKVVNFIKLFNLLNPQKLHLFLANFTSLLLLLSFKFKY